MEPVERGRIVAVGMFYDINVLIISFYQVQQNLLNTKQGEYSMCTAKTFEVAHFAALVSGRVCQQTINTKSPL